MPPFGPHCRALRVARPAGSHSFRLAKIGLTRVHGEGPHSCAASPGNDVPLAALGLHLLARSASIY